MSALVRGAFVQYSLDLQASIPNLVVFQFNPDKLTRTFQIPQRPTGVNSKESSQAGDVPVEKISLTAQFDASDDLGNNDLAARQFGVGPRIYALEKMITPPSVWTQGAAQKLGNLLSSAVSSVAGTAAGSAVGSALGMITSSAGDSSWQPIPRIEYPRILFVWGKTRVVPVTIESLSVTEMQYDSALNPVFAEVAISMSVALELESKDPVGYGALQWTSTAKDAQAAVNLANTIGSLPVDIVKML